MFSRPIVLLALPLLLACSQAAREQAPSPESTARASELYERLKTYQDEGNLEAAAVNAREIIHNYPTYPLIDEVMYRAGVIAFEQERFADAATHFDRLNADYPLSPFRQRALLSSARAYDRIDQPAHAAERLAELLASPVEQDIREEAAHDLRTLVYTRLSPQEMEALVREYPDSAIYRETAFDLARRAYARGDYDEAYELLGELLYRFPEGPQSHEARRLLTQVSERRQAGATRPSTAVDPNTIGVILPVTGQLSLYGRLFEQGVTMAVAEYNEESGTPVRLATADSRGNPVSGATAARKLIEEDGALVLLGSVFTMPTVSASIEANAWQVPLLSPVVSTDNLGEVGPWIFQTKVPYSVEATAMADLATGRLLLERFAVISPSGGSGRNVGDFFAREVKRLGGEIVAFEYYEEGATDFRFQLEAVREAAPEAIFAPSTVEELLLLLPQVKFYDLQVQLLGLSNWNSDKLLRLSRDELEGALFPLETYHGNDPAAYQRFKLAMEEQGVGEVSPVSVAGYFGMRLLLEGVSRGAASRDDMRAWLEAQIHGDAESRSERAAALSILTVRRGHTREFRPPEPVSPFN